MALVGLMARSKWSVQLKVQEAHKAGQLSVSSAAVCVDAVSTCCPTGFYGNSYHGSCFIN